MTRAEIMALKPGEELDKLIAIHIFKDPEPPPASGNDAINSELAAGPRTHSEKESWCLGTTGYEHGDEPKWFPMQFSTEIFYAWKVVDFVSELVCPFASTDGSFKLLRMDWGDHNHFYEEDFSLPPSDKEKEQPFKIPQHHLCKLEHSQEHEDKAWDLRPKDDEDIDPQPWSAHFHIGLIGQLFADSGKMPSHWEHGSSFCAYGATPMEAICKAALLTILGG